MFAPPENIPTEVFVEIPGEFKKVRRSPWSDMRRGGKPIHSFLEGSSFDREGNLYVTDIPFGRIFRITPERRVTLVAEYDGEPNGLKIRADGRIFITDYAHGIMELDPVRGTVTSVLGRRYSERFGGVTSVGTAIQMSGGIGPDGLALTADGGLAVGHPGMGAVWVFSRRGEPLYRVNSCGSDLITNIAFGDADMKSLYITDSGAGQILRARLPVAGRAMHSHAQAGQVVSGAPVTGA